MKKDNVGKLIKEFLIEMSPYVAVGVAEFVNKKINEKVIDVEEVEEVETPVKKDEKKSKNKDLENKVKELEQKIKDLESRLQDIEFIFDNFN